MGVFHEIASHAYTMYCFRENNSQENTRMRAEIKAYKLSTELYDVKASNKRFWHIYLTKKS